MENNTIKKNKLFYVINSDWFFLSHRLPIAIEAYNQGFSITIITTDTGRRKEIENYGFKFVDLPLFRSGINPIAELRTILFLRKIYRKLKPDIVHHVALKAVIYGTIAAKNKDIKIINAISGLGFTFIQNNKVPLLRMVLLRLLKFVLRNPESTLIFQNPDDIAFLKEKKVISGFERIVLIKGSGVDLNLYKYKPEPENSSIIITLHSRMLWDKGIMEYIKAARKLKTKYGDRLTFLLIGGIDSNNRSAIPEKELQKWNNEGIIKWIGHQTDIIKFLNESHISVLPSYREGLPKSLIEAAACGKPIVTTNVPGCKEVVKDSVNGFLVEPYKVEELAKAIEKLIVNKELRLKMGEGSRRIAEQEFSINIVIDKTITIYNNFLN